LIVEQRERASASSGGWGQPHWWHGGGICEIEEVQNYQNRPEWIESQEYNTCNSVPVVSPANGNNINDHLVDTQQ